MTMVEATTFENIGVGVRIKRIAFVAVKVYAAALYAEKGRFKPQTAKESAAEFVKGRSPLRYEIRSILPSFSIRALRLRRPLVVVFSVLWKPSRIVFL